MQDSARMYVNGILVNTLDLSTETGTNMPTTTYIGKPTMDVRYFNGVFDDFRVYSKILDESEVISLYNEGKCIETVYETVYDTVTVVVYDTITNPYNKFQYIKFQSTYSEDAGQVNVYEIQAYTEGANIALNKSTWFNSGSNGASAVDNEEFSRWSSNRNDAGPDLENPHYIIVDLQQIYSVDSVLLNIAGFDNWRQNFELSVSNDSKSWYKIGEGNNETGIFTYYPKPNTNIYYDTIYTTVTDTLVINTVVTGLEEPNNLNAIKIYPNPAKDHLFINTGNYTKMNGYRIEIINSMGTQMFETFINDPLYEINLSSWTGTGLYFVQIIDTNSQIVDIRKIIIQ